MTTSSPAIEWLTHRGLGRLVLTVVMLSLLLPASSSAQGESRVTVKKDLIYGRVEGSALLADIASPEGNERLPAIIYVHGGSWRGGSRTGRRSLDVGDWAQSGFFAMTIDYRLVGATPAPAAYLDLLCAIRWVHAHAEEYSIDPERVYLIGNSAGGHLVSLAATLGEGPHARVGGWDDARSDVRAVISASGAYDVNTLSWGTLWTPISGDVEAARRLASPMHHVTTASTPILVLHSDDDESVPVQQAVDMVQALEKASVLHRFVRYADRGHMGITEEVVQEARAFIAEVEEYR